MSDVSHKKNSIFTKLVTLIFVMTGFVAIMVVAMQLSSGYVHELLGKYREYKFYQNPTLARSELVELNNFKIIFSVRCNGVLHSGYPTAYISTIGRDELLLPDSMTHNMRDSFGIPTCETKGRYATLYIDKARLEKFYDRYFVIELQGKNMRGEPLSLQLEPPTMQEKAFIYGQMYTTFSIIFEVILWFVLCILGMLILGFTSEAVQKFMSKMKR